MALLGQSVLSAMGGGVIMGLGIGATVIGIWVTMAVMARRAVRGENEADEEKSAAD